MRAVGEVGVFGERVVLPAAGLVDGLAPPHAGGAVEVEEDAAAGAPGMLEHKMAVEQDGFDLGEQRIVAVNVRPAGLHHADFGVGEMVDALKQEIGRWNKVGVEDGDELALGRLEAGLERSGFEAVAIFAVDVGDRIAQRGVAVYEGAGDLDGFVG